MGLTAKGRGLNLMSWGGAGRRGRSDAIMPGAASRAAAEEGE
jgi:hypothetical protein